MFPDIALIGDAIPVTLIILDNTLVHAPLTAVNLTLYDPLAEYV